MVELILPATRSILDIPVILDIVDVEILPLIGFDALDGNNILVDNVRSHLWNRIITNKDPLRFEDVWKIKLIMKGEYLYISLSTSIQLFYTMEKLWMLQKLFINPSETKLHDPLRTAGTKNVAPKTLEKLEYLVSTCDPCQKIGTAPK